MRAVLALMLLVGLAACQPPVTSPPPPVPVGTRQTVCTSAADFAAKFRVVTGFNYRQGNGTFVGPTTNQALTPGTSEYAFVTRVYGLLSAVSPPLLVTLICSDTVDYVYLYDNGDPDDGGFAFWPAEGQTAPRLLGVPVKYARGAVETFWQMEMDWLGKQNLDAPGVYITYTAGSPIYGDPQASVFISLLAHEAGHLVWYLAAPPRLCGPGDPFMNGSWSNLNVAVGSEAGYPYHEFGQGFNSHLNPSSDPEYKQVRADLRGHSTSTLKKLLRDDGTFGSLLAAAAPDEDFAESYRYYLDTQLGLQREKIYSGSSLVANFKPKIRRKNDCVATIQGSVLLSH